MRIFQLTLIALEFFQKSFSVLPTFNIFRILLLVSLNGQLDEFSKCTDVTDSGLPARYEADRQLVFYGMVLKEFENSFDFVFK
jgi:hypothetical protein